MPHYRSFLKTIRKENLGILICSDEFDLNYLKEFLIGKKLKSE